jgi:hypothetical protein
MPPDAGRGWRSPSGQPPAVVRRSTVMSYGFLDIAVTPSVRAVQAKMGADGIWKDFKGHREFDPLTEDEVAFIAARDVTAPIVTE